MIINSLTKIKKKLYLKDPEATELGQKIIYHSIILIDEIGFDIFNFKKLASEIKSTEASIYRYFENKHKLLFYLINWYWNSVKYRIDHQIYNIKNPNDKIKIVIKVICGNLQGDSIIEYINESRLSRIVLTESTKSYTTKRVEEDYRDGLFEVYKEVCTRISDIIQAINPDFHNPRALAVTIIRTAYKQLYFGRHLPDLTDLNISEDNTSEIEEFIELLVFSALKHKK